MKITEMAFVGYCVTDMDRARSFYEGFLGLKQSRDLGNKGQWIEYDIGSATLAVIRGDGKDWVPSSRGTAAAFEVDDFEGFVAKAKSSGVKIVFDVIDAPECWMLVVADPDGNRVGMHKHKPKS